MVNEVISKRRRRRSNRKHGRPNIKPEGMCFWYALLLADCSFVCAEVLIVWLRIRNSSRAFLREEMKIEHVADKMLSTLHVCRDAVNGRTPYVIMQRDVRIRSSSSSRIYAVKG